MNKTLNNRKLVSRLLFVSKPLCFLFLLFVQNFHSQIFISEGAFIHDEKEVIVSKTDSLDSNSSKGNIYISLGAEVANFVSEKNYEIVKMLPLENNKTEPKKQSVLHVAKRHLEKKAEQNIVSKKVNPVLNKLYFSNLKSEIYFSFIKGFSKITAPVSQFSAKQIINSENCITSLVVGWSDLVSVYFKNASLVTAQNKSAFSVRPPPVFSA